MKSEPMKSANVRMAELSLGMPLDNYECLSQPLYDTVAYPEAGGSVYLFQNPVGAADKDFADTNMFLGRRLPQNVLFIIDRISVKLLNQGSHALSSAATRKFYNSGCMEFRIGAKNYATMAPIGDTRGDVQSPEISILFDKTGPHVALSGSSGAEPTPFTLEPNNLLLVPNQSFCLTLSRLKPLHTPARIHAKLFGTLCRQTQ